MGNTIKGNPLEQDEFNQNYIIRESNTDKVFGDYIELDQKDGTKKFVLKQYNCLDENDRKITLERLNRYKSDVSPNILKVDKIFEQITKTACSSIIVLHFVMEKYDITLMDEINQRTFQGQRKYFSENQLWNILKQLVSAYGHFQTNKIQQSIVHPDNILIYYPLYKICDYDILQTNNNQFDQALFQNDEEDFNLQCYFSPQQLSALKNKITHPHYDTYKSAVFQLGMSLLHCSRLENCYDLYNLKKKFISEIVLKQQLDELENRYSKIFVDVIRSMLSFDDIIRPDFEILDDLLQNNQLISSHTQMLNNTFEKQKLNILQTFEDIREEKNNYNTLKTSILQSKSRNVVKFDDQKTDDIDQLVLSLESKRKSSFLDNKQVKIPKIEPDQDNIRNSARRSFREDEIRILIDKTDDFERNVRRSREMKNSPVRNSVVFNTSNNSFDYHDKRKSLNLDIQSKYDDRQINKIQSSRKSQAQLDRLVYMEEQLKYDTSKIQDYDDFKKNQEYANTRKKSLLSPERSVSFQKNKVDQVLDNIETEKIKKLLKQSQMTRQETKKSSFRIDSQSNNLNISNQNEQILQMDSPHVRSSISRTQRRSFVSPTRKSISPQQKTQKGIEHLQEKTKDILSKYGIAPESVIKQNIQRKYTSNQNLNEESISRVEQILKKYQAS